MKKMLKNYFCKLKYKNKWKINNSSVDRLIQEWKSCNSNHQLCSDSWTKLSSMFKLKYIYVCTKESKLTRKIVFRNLRKIISSTSSLAINSSIIQVMPKLDSISGLQGALTTWEPNSNQASTFITLESHPIGWRPASVFHLLLYGPRSLGSKRLGWYVFSFLPFMFLFFSSRFLGLYCSLKNWTRYP